MNKKLIAIIGGLGVLWLTASVFLAVPAAADTEDLKTPINFMPQIKMPGIDYAQDGSTPVGQYDEETGNMNSTLLARYIQGFYNYALMIAGILAAIVLMGGGLLWLASGGDSGRISLAKELITGSLVGLIILFSAWIILNTINPDLLKLRPITTQVIKQLHYGCCEHSGGASSVTKEECEKGQGNFYTNTVDTVYMVGETKCVPIDIRCNIKKDCDGNVVLCFDSETKMTKKENCGGFFGNDMRLLYEQKGGRCLSHQECAGKMANCLNVEDGDKCERSESGKKVDGHCYMSMCYVGQGQALEPCGDEPGSYCSTISCSKIGQTGEKYYSDTRGGRECLAGLFCCYKDTGE